MADLRRYFIPTPHGEVGLVFGSLARADVLAIIHGAARRSLQLRPWAERDAVLVELPGHGSAPMIEARIEVWAAAFQAALRQLWPDRPLTLVGESLGGVIALHMDAERRILLDPPLEATPAVAHEIRHGHIAPWLQPLITADYWPLLDSQSQTVEVVCASDGILPERARRRLCVHPRVAYSLVRGGHVLLDDNPQAVLELIQKRPPGDSPAAERRQTGHPPLKPWDAP